MPSCWAGQPPPAAPPRTRLCRVMRAAAPPPPSSDGSRPGTPLCDENPENLMSRSAAAPVRLASHLRQQNNSEPMSLPLPRFAQHVLSTSPGERSQRSLQISPREPRPDMIAVQAPAQTTNSLKQSRPELSKLSIMSPTKFGPGSADLRARDPRLKSPSLKSPGLQPPLKSPVHHPVQPVIPTEKDPKASDPSD